MAQKNKQNEVSVEVYDHHLDEVEIEQWINSILISEVKSRCHLYDECQPDFGIQDAYEKAFNEIRDIIFLNQSDNITGQLYTKFHCNINYQLEFMLFIRIYFIALLFSTLNFYNYI